MGLPRAFHCSGEEERYVGVVPMRMDSSTALKYLHQHGADPDVIYVDGDHRYDGIARDVRTALELFPKSLILGNGYSTSKSGER